MFKYGDRLTSGRWYVAKGKVRIDSVDFGRKYARYPGPELCRTGWHVWPVRAASGHGWPYTKTGWRRLRDEASTWEWGGKRKVYLVAVKGRFHKDVQKLAADQIRFIRELTPAQQSLLRMNASESQLRKVLGLPESALVWFNK
jgi:hypothetical protein